jgi:hypothetical protein
MREPSVYFFQRSFDAERIGVDITRVNYLRVSKRHGFRGRIVWAK